MIEQDRKRKLRQQQILIHKPTKPKSTTTTMIIPSLLSQLYIYSKRNRINKNIQITDGFKVHNYPFNNFSKEVQYA